VPFSHHASQVLAAARHASSVSGLAMGRIVLACVVVIVICVYLIDKAGR
jgi:hypothetical protein